MATDLEGAVEQLIKLRDELARKSQYINHIPSARERDAGNANAIDTILDALASITRERDAMLEAHRPYAAVSAKAKGKDDDCWCGQDGAVIRYRDLRLSAALVNGEGGE